MEFTSAKDLRHACRKLATVLSLSAGIVAAAESANMVPLHESLRCTPTLSYFCSNIHIGCAGQSTLKTWLFTITMNGDEGKMVPVSDPTDSKNPTRDGAIVRAKDNDSMILFLHPTKDYIKVSSTGKFNFRHYTQRGALMTYGWCAVEVGAGVKAD